MQQKMAQQAAANPQQAFQQQQMMAMMRNQATLQQQQRMNGNTLLRLYSFADQISRFVAGENRDEQHWRDFVDKFFAPDSSLRHVVKDNNSNKTKQFEVFFPSLPRYFHVHYDGIEQIQILIENPSEKPLPQHHVVEAPRARFIYNFKNGTIVRLPCSVI